LGLYFSLSEEKKKGRKEKKERKKAELKKKQGRRGISWKCRRKNIKKTSDQKERKWANKNENICRMK
jgi:hypothetical protein